jgi:hypothetical protein
VREVFREADQRGAGSVGDLPSDDQAEDGGRQCEGANPLAKFAVGEEVGNMVHPDQNVDGKRVSGREIFSQDFSGNRFQNLAEGARWKGGDRVTDLRDFCHAEFEPGRGSGETRSDVYLKNTT